METVINTMQRVEKIYSHIGTISFNYAINGCVILFYNIAVLFVLLTLGII